MSDQEWKDEEEISLSEVNEKIRQMPMAKVKEKTMSLLPRFASLKRWATSIPSETEEALNNLDPETQWLLRTYETILLDIHDAATIEISAAYLLNKEGIPPDYIKIGSIDYGDRWIITRPNNPQTIVLRPAWWFLFWKRDPQIEEEWPSVFHFLMSEIVGELWVYSDDENSRKLFEWAMEFPIKRQERKDEAFS